VWVGERSRYLSILWMLPPITRQTQRLASMNVWKATQDGDEVAFPRCFEPSYGIAGIFSVVGHLLHDALRCSAGGWSARSTGESGDDDTGMVPLFYFKKSIAVVWGVGKPDMAVAEGGDRRSRWISNDYAAFSAVW